ncbi:flagellar basal body-associated FliL family protein [Undibacterium sp. TJN19]|uniref:flagellar basal body-associated FliL family protein n=1 Tax=Undibacterium sp. TJN19 TaxID=3413055 RepID=UPI003BF3FFC2
MPKDRSRASILSEQLDFEGVDGSNPKVPDSAALNFETETSAGASTAATMNKPANTSLASTSGSGTSTRTSRPAVKSAPAKKTASVTKTSARKGVQARDRFGIYAAIIVLLGLAIMLALFFYVRTVNYNAAGLAYATLPQQVANVDGQVVRMQITIQVRDEDSEWLSENKKSLANLFQIELGKVNPDDLHSETGFELVRAQLKAGLNKSMQTDKIESVLINELLMQNRSE